MTPSLWMSEPSFKKIRSQRKTWTGKDFLALSKELFSTTDLTIEQLDELVTKLKDPTLVPTGGPARKTVFGLVSNTGKYTGTSNRIYLSKRKVSVQFKDLDTALDWGFRLSKLEPKYLWEESLKVYALNTSFDSFYKHWSENLNISGLLGLREYKLDSQLVTSLEAHRRSREIMLAAFPDHTPLDRVYYSLSIGDKLVDSLGSTWTVRGRKVHLDQPPELTLEV